MESFLYVPQLLNVEQTDIRGQGFHTEEKAVCVGLVRGENRGRTDSAYEHVTAEICMGGLHTHKNRC